MGKAREDKTCETSCKVNWEENSGRCFLWGGKKERGWDEAEEFCQKESNNVTSRPGRQKSALLAPIIGGNHWRQSLAPIIGGAQKPPASHHASSEKGAFGWWQIEWQPNL